MLTIHSTIQALQLPTLRCPSTKPTFLALCLVNCSLVSEWVTRTIPHFVIGLSKMFYFGVVKFETFLTIKCQKSSNFCSFCKVLTLHCSMKNICKLTVIQTTTVAHNFMQVSCTTKRLLCEFVFFLEDRMSSAELSQQYNLPTPPFLTFNLQTQNLVQCKTYCSGNQKT